MSSIGHYITFRQTKDLDLPVSCGGSAVSVSSNIAEGSSRSSKVDLARFIEIAYGSLLESVSELETAKRQRFLNDEMFEAVYNKTEDLAKMLSGLRRTLKGRS